MTIPARPPSGPERTFAALGLGEALARVIVFSVTIHLARVLGPSGYGVIGVATAVLLYFTALADGGIEYLGAREVAAAPDRTRALAEAALGVRLTVAAALVLCLAVIGVFVLPEPDGAVLAVYGLTLLPAAASVRWIHLGAERAGRIAIARVTGETVMAIGVWTLVRSVGDIARVPAAQFTGDVVAALLLALFLRRAGIPLRLRFRPSRALPMLHRAWPLTAHALLGLVIFNSDFLVLRAFKDARAVGLYAAVYTLVSFAINLGGAYGQSMITPLTRVRHDPAALQSLYRRCLQHLLVVGLPMAVGGSLLAGDIVPFLFGPQYAPAADALRILLWSVPVALVRNGAMIGLIALNAPRDVLRTTSWAAVFNVGLNIALIPFIGILGAAISTLLTELVRMFLTVLFVTRLHLPFPGFRPFWKPSAAAVVMGLGLLMAPVLHPLAAVALGAVIYGVVLLVLGGLWRPKMSVDPR